MAASLTANEVVDMMKRKKEAEIMYKLDIKKAYEHVNLGSLSFVMKQIGCKGNGIKWIKWYF